VVSGSHPNGRGAEKPSKLAGPVGRAGVDPLRLRIGGDIPEAVRGRETGVEDEPGYFGGIGAREASRRGAESRRKKAAAKREAQAAAEVNASRTFRQRLGAALSKLDQQTLDAVVAKLAKQGNANALARLADQAFGRPNEQDEAQRSETGLSGLSRDDLATMQADLDALPVTPASPGGPAGGDATPAAAEPRGRDLSRNQPPRQKRR